MIFLCVHVIVFIKSGFLTPQYEGSIVENTHSMEVMRFKAFDLDMKNTANWEAMYHISKGNEAGYFSIKTDPVTNEGILMLDKVKKKKKRQDKQPQQQH